MEKSDCIQYYWFVYNIIYDYPVEAHKNAPAVTCRGKGKLSYFTKKLVQYYGKSTGNTEEAGNQSLDNRNLHGKARQRAYQIDEPQQQCAAETIPHQLKRHRQQLYYQQKQQYAANHRPQGTKRCQNSIKFHIK